MVTQGLQIAVTGVTDWHFANGSVTLAPVALKKWRLSQGMERQHLAREIGFSSREVARLERGHMGLVGRDWVAGELVALGAPRRAVKALQSHPDCQHTQTTTHTSTVAHIHRGPQQVSVVLCASCGWELGRTP